MDSVPDTAIDRGSNRHAIEVADASLTFRSVTIADLTPTGQQLAAAAGFKRSQQATVLQMLADGELEDIRPDEVVDLRHSDGRFVIVESDHSDRLTIDGERFDWPCRIVSGAVIRKLGRIPPERSIFLEQSETPDLPIGDADLVDIGKPGVEAFVSRLVRWQLNVQGVVLDVEAPMIGVRDAILRAGFNPDQGWQIFLKIAGQAKRPVALGDSIDLRTPGIEKLRLTPNEVNNGEAPWAPRRVFDLLDVDHDHLARLGLRWETIEEAGRRWLLFHDYPVPTGYTINHTPLALEIPPIYPHAQLYGFYAYPPLALSSGREIDNTQLRGTIDGREFHGWSRNRGGLVWNAARDNVASHLMLVDAALAREVGE